MGDSFVEGDFEYIVQRSKPPACQLLKRKRYGDQEDYQGFEVVLLSKNTKALPWRNPEETQADTWFMPATSEWGKSGWSYMADRESDAELRYLALTTLPIEKARLRFDLLKAEFGKASPTDEIHNQA